jgi:hypothetical protein
MNQHSACETDETPVANATATKELFRDADAPSLSRGERVGVRANVNRLLLAGVLCLLSTLLHAQNYSIDWFTIDGGGGTSSGGNFSLSGTIGQPDAGTQPMTGGGFSLTGGFWSLFAVQTPAAPQLLIRLTSPNTALVSWPSPSTGFRLQENTDLNPTNWINVSLQVTDNGSTKSVIVNSSAGPRCYRLSKP